ncbi:MAG: MFS transporter [Candidatus Thermoplasmatota archaeon]|nr:MFS transporter [Candidatus Thermoplasmatota archaeon]
MSDLFDEFLEEWKELKVFYFGTIVSTLGFSLTAFIEVIYLVAIGLSYTKIGFIFLLYGILRAVVEIPTGIIADKYGRKTSSTLGLLICAISFILLPLSFNYLYILFFFNLFSFGSSLLSGAYMAWIVDTLKMRGLKDWIHRVTGRMGSIRGLMMTFGSLLGAYLLFQFLVLSGSVEVINPTAILVMRSLFVIHGLLFLIDFIVLSYWGKEVPLMEKKKKETFLEYIKNVIEESKDIIISRQIVLVLLTNSFIFFIAFAALRDTWEPFLTTILGYPIYWLGIVAAVTSFISFLTNLKSEEFTEWVGDYPATLFLLLLTLGCIVISLSFISFAPLVIIVYITIIAIWNFYGPIRGAYFQQNIPSNVRATMGSISAFIIELSGGVGSVLIFGMIGEFFGLRTVLLLSGIVVIISSSLYLILIRKE